MEAGGEKNERVMEEWRPCVYGGEEWEEREKDGGSEERDGVSEGQRP